MLTLDQPLASKVLLMPRLKLVLSLSVIKPVLKATPCLLVISLSVLTKTPFVTSSRIRAVSWVFVFPLTLTLVVLRDMDTSSFLP
jgi:hypothetical protein